MGIVSINSFISIDIASQLLCTKGVARTMKIFTHLSIRIQCNVTITYVMRIWPLQGYDLLLESDRIAINIVITCLHFF